MCEVFTPKAGEKFECSVCYDMIEENEQGIRLKCGHTYHYDCILLSYQMKTDKKRECPYCREDGGYLPLLDNQKPIKDIHKEWLVENKNYGYFGRCIAITKSGKNKGKRCMCKANGSDKYCGRHRPKYTNTE